MILSSAAQRYEAKKEARLRFEVAAQRSGVTVAGFARMPYDRPVAEDRGRVTT